MSRSKALRTTSACVAALLVVGLGPSFAHAAAVLLQPSTDHCLSDEMNVWVQPTPRELSADERRVVLWVVHQILSADDDDTSTLVFTDAQVSAALHVDVRGLDRDRIREHVRATLVGHSCQRALEVLQ